MKFTITERRTIKHMFRKGISIEQIVKLTKFNKKQVEQILKEKTF